MKRLHTFGIFAALILLSGFDFGSIVGVLDAGWAFLTSLAHSLVTKRESRIILGLLLLLGYITCFLYIKGFVEPEHKELDGCLRRDP